MTTGKNELLNTLAQLASTPFGDLVPKSTVITMLARGLGSHLLPTILPTVRAFIDPASFPIHEIEPTLADLEAVTDPEQRAEALYFNRVHGLCERSRALIHSVDGVSIIGTLLQANLVPPQPRRPTPPRPRPPKPPTFRNLPSLFALFGED